MGTANDDVTVDPRDVEIDADDDVLTARTAAREVATELGFGLTDVTRIVTATSELARNVHLHGDGGEVTVREIDDPDRSGIELAFADRGPGIPDVEKAFAGELSTREGLGRGLSGSRKLMDEMEVDTEAGEGTTITIRKWIR